VELEEEDHREWIDFDDKEDEVNRKTAKRTTTLDTIPKKGAVKNRYSRK
jgi:hypothetical protein